MAATALAVSALLLPLVGIFAPLGLAPLGAVAALACLPLVIRERSWGNLPAAVLWLPLLLAVWAAVSALWAIDPREALAGAAKQALSTIGGLILVAAALDLDQKDRRRLAWYLMAGSLAGAALLTAEYLTDRGISSLIAKAKHRPLVGIKSPLNRGATILILCTATCMAQFRHSKPRWPLVVSAIALLAMFSSDSLSTRLAALTGLAAGAIVMAWPRRGIHLVIAAVAALWIVAPIGAANMPSPHYTFQHWTWLPLSSHHRTTIWGFTGSHIAEKPIIGWGMEASRQLPGADDEVQLWRTFDNGQPRLGITESMLPLHPHNGILQIWLELGVFGALLAGAFLVRVLAGIDRLDSADRTGRAIACGIYCAALTIGTTSYGIWQSWWQAGLWFIAAFTLSGLKQRDIP
ncbi:O-antigen ligase family protein [Paramagnetospirillum caucaseum]|uniref:O-antigen ligase family protein n=1 Tax=Paramagnetospirillum caucaseum TaxID=1244869 RepID=UPI001377B522|nr:O-antigen ligase family protein [Paramagnetospirillum caucaseum]